jgi:hypothetical protein
MNEVEHMHPTIYTMISPWSNSALIRFTVFSHGTGLQFFRMDGDGSWLADDHLLFWNAPPSLRLSWLPTEDARVAWTLMRRDGWTDIREMPVEDYDRLRKSFPHPLNGTLA